MSKLTALVVSFGVALTGSAALAADHIALPGGQMDPAIADQDVYIGKPVPADPGNVPACRQAKLYIDGHNSGNPENVAKLFAEDAFFLDPFRKNVGGKMDVHHFFRDIAGVGKHAELMGVGYTGSGADCVLEIATVVKINGEDRWTLVAADHFTLDANGKFSRFLTYLRPKASGGTAPLQPYK
jgi:hypothetical protein